MDTLRSAPLEDPVARTFSALFEHLPDVYFFVKDEKSRFLHANRALLDRLGLGSVGEICGTSDFDRYPLHVAEQLVAGDRRIMESGVPLIDHAEVLFDHSGRLEWYSTSKYPILDPTGRALGVAGITRSFSQRRRRQNNLHAAGRAIDYISENPTSPLRVSALAKQVGISERQLHRQFLDLVKMPPREFVLRSRIQAAAADLRESNESIASLGEKYGFCDQSAFTRQFRKWLGTTPARYRNSFSSHSPSS